MPTLSPTVQLNDNRHIPQLGLGVFQVPNEECVRVIHAALEAGYRSIDTAAVYRNETGVGEAIRTGSVTRDELYITTKLWNDRHTDAPKALEESLEKLGLNYVDLYLIHWPAPARKQYVQAWKALGELREEGLVHSIGVSNFNLDHLQEIYEVTGIIPAVNQIELHPGLPQKELREYHASQGILTESWSPLARGTDLLKNPILTDLAQKHGKTPAQIVLRWHLDLGCIVIPKSVTESRIRENFDVFDFKLDAEDLTQIAKLENGKRTGPDPAAFS